MNNGKSKRAGIYARVSTDGQTTENQLRELRLVAERNGWQIVQEFIDHGISGAKGREQRPAFDALWKGATRREFDVVMVWAVDRLGRSLSHLVNFLSEIHSKKVCKLPCQRDTTKGELLDSSWARYVAGGKPASASWGRSSL